MVSAMRDGKIFLLVWMTVLLFVGRIYGQQVYIAPILSVDEGGEQYGIEENIREDMLRSMEEQKGSLAMTVVKTAERVKTER